MRRLTFSGLLIVAMLILIPTVAFAGTSMWSGDEVTITFITPDTYYACPENGASDTIAVEGLPADWTLEGWVHTQFVVPTGRVTYAFAQVNFTSDGANPFEFKVDYPPISEWPATLEPDTGLRELHVDISISVFDAEGYLVPWVGNSAAPGTLGPGNDWNVFCFYSPPPPDVGVGTPGYWKNHPDAWPVESVTIGGVTYTKTEAIELMNLPDGDKSLTMFRALVTAKLTVLIGADNSCVASTISEADAWLVLYPAGSGVEASSDAWQDGGEALYEYLDEYNNGELCAPERD